MSCNPKIPFVEYYLNKYAQKGDLIIDIGCGTAQYRKSTQAKYMGIDITSDDYNAGYPRNVDLVASATDIPLSENFCDLIFCIGVLYQVPDYSMAINEFYRVLKPGGRILIFDYNRRTQKKLSVREGHKLPCWTQWELRRLIQKSGFRDCELLVPVPAMVSAILKNLCLVNQEFNGEWAIVTGVK